jgi:hypothetical protein
MCAAAPKLKNSVFFSLLAGNLGNRDRFDSDCVRHHSLDVVTDRAQKVVSEVKTEAQNQGLTPEVAKSAATDIGKKVKAVAGAGRESVAQSFAPKPK